MPGTMKLVNKRGWKKKTAAYKNYEDFKRTIFVWRNIYGVAFDNYFVHLIPDVEAETDKNGKLYATKD
jgi:hypothetical protein